MRTSFFVVTAMLLACLTYPTQADEPALVRADISTVKSVKLEVGKWTYAPAKVDVKVTDAPVRLPGEGAILGGVRSKFDSVVPGGVSVAAIQYLTGSQQQNLKHLEQWGISLLDLRTGACGPVTHLPIDYTAKAITPDGARAAISGKSIFSEFVSEIQIVKLQGEAAEVELAFMPYEGEEEGHRAVTWARFIDKDHLLTLGQSRRLILWHITAKEVKGIWSLMMPEHFGGDPVLTFDSRYAVIVDEKGTYLLDAATGAVAGAISDPVTRSWFSASGLQNVMRPDGKMLARATNPRVKIYSLDGEAKLIADVFMPPKTKIDSAVWTGDDYLLVNRCYLINVKKGLVVWQYSGLGGKLGEHAALFPAGERMWLVNGGNDKMAIKSFVMPEDDVKKAVAAIDVEEIMAIKPGMKVNLDVDIPDRKIADAVKTHFKTELQKNNMIVADGSPVRLRVKISDLNTRDVEYHDAIRPFSGRTSHVSVNNQQMTVTYEVDGQTLWDITIYSGAPMMLTIEHGQTIDQAVKEKQKGDWKQLDEIELPKYVPAFRDPPGFGQTAMNSDRRR
ncbi:MAG TPA: hypothetical protein VIL86_05425 [Tepidisphaeraceae bacterium]|jgi:hypothetical protein